MNIRPMKTFGAGLILALAIVSCQTAKPKIEPAGPASPAPSSISTESEGFSPKADAGHNKIDFALSFGNPEAVKAWKVEMQLDKVTQKTFSGTGGTLPSSLGWDGFSDSGKAAPEGSYSATLGIDYGTAYQGAQVSSSSFILDLSPPSGQLVVGGGALVPGAKGFVSPASIKVEATSRLAHIDSWSLDILDSEGRVFRSFSDKWPSNVASWDGLSSSGEQAAPATTYTAIAKVRDEFGNVGSLSATLAVADIPSASGSSSIEARYAGFAPKGESAIKTMDFAIAIGQKEAVKAWKVEIVLSNNLHPKTYSGNPTKLPSSLSWDGTGEGGAMAPEGQYYAVLSVDYGSAYKALVVRSKPFVLDLTPPSGTIAVDPPRLSPDAKGALKPMTFTLLANSNLAPLDSWELTVYGWDGGAAMVSKGQFPKASATWDGKLKDGSYLDPTRTYRLAAKVTDRFGNVGNLRGSIDRAEVAGAAAAPELPDISSSVSIKAGSAGFSPNGDSAMDAMKLALVYGQPEAVKNWKVEILNAGHVARTFTGASDSLPASISWDGRKDDGKPAEEGIYTASLDVDFGKAFKPASVSSGTFVLDLTPPFGSITLSDPLFSPIEANSTITMTIDASSNVATMDSWSLRIYDPAGNLFKSFEGKWPDHKATWDGKGISGDMVESAEDYSLVASVRDEFGNAAELKSTLPVDILVEKTATGYRILSSRIFFRAYTADYLSVPAELADQNMRRLDQLATKLKKFPNYRIKVVGHAVMINWNDPAKGRVEQAEILLPLSSSRAEAVKKAMVDRGLDPSLIATEGVGASDQLVPDSDLANRWRNRRVAFFLEK
jgi:flagellar hook assembly protein FlgD